MTIFGGVFMINDSFSYTVVLSFILILEEKLLKGNDTNVVLNTLSQSE